ncbi:MAG: anti-sigma regulatory factor [Phycisphaera sp.]|nr:MAG: anti-sigma regulatory factor [Phycisphaera sp.]
MEVHANVPDPQAQPATPQGRVEVANDRSAITALGERVLAAAEIAGYSEASRFAVRLALEEALVNAFRHGHKDLPKNETVGVEFEVDERSIRLVVTDRGPGFAPDDVPDPTSDENLTKTSGRGLLLMRAYMTEITHNQAGNQIRMRYCKPASEG